MIIPSISETMCAIIRKMKKKASLRNWVVLSKRVEKKKRILRTAAYIHRILDSLYSNAIVRHATYASYGTENKEKNDRKRTRRRKETSWRHRPETERFQM